MRTYRVLFDDLQTSDLIVGAIYEGGTSGNVGDDPIAPLLGVGNMGGFRFKGSPMPAGCLLVGLFTTQAQSDWPDHFDEMSKIFTYYGDNRSPGTELLETNSGGNALLEYMFDSIHAEPARREDVPPVFIFEQVPDSGRDVRFLGLAAPGVPADVAVEDLQVITQGEGDSRIVNYRARFTVLDAPVVQRAWIESLQTGAPDPALAPTAWRRWVEDGIYTVARVGEASETTDVVPRIRFMIPTGGPEGWRVLLAQPELHWKSGRSARTMAHAWEAAEGWPAEFEAALVAVPALAEFEPIFGFPELKTPLPGGSRASQTDLMVVATDGHRWLTMAVEGKVDESLGDYVETWLGEDPSPGKRLRLAYLADELGVDEADLMGVRYQLVHRSAAAIIEARRNSGMAAMAVHVWSDVADGFADFEDFASILGVEAKVGCLSYSETADLWLGWIRGDDRYLEA